MNTLPMDLVRLISLYVPTAYEFTFPCGCVSDNFDGCWQDHPDDVEPAWAYLYKGKPSGFMLWAQPKAEMYQSPF